MKIQLRDYQNDAIKKFRANGWKGIFEMATGTGKTFTSIYASLEYRKSKGSIFRVIIVPYLHLISQWESELSRLGIENIIECSSNNIYWEFDVHKEIRHYNLGRKKEVTIITSYASASSEKFIDLIRRIDKNIFLIADECHYFGANKIDRDYYKNIDGRLGLSATPARWWDDRGTENIFSFFNGVVYEYSLEKAIKNKFLVEYTYNPIIIDLYDTELEEFMKLTRQISIMINKKETDSQKFMMISLKRKNLISNAVEKMDRFKELIKGKKNKKDTLVYCNSSNLSETTRIVGSEGLKVRKFNYQVPNNEREEILRDFREGDIEVLTAIKCLDEGVDIPSVKDAIFISSTSNPREFIQRRGRILRKNKNKIIANIYDFIVLPDISDSSIFEMIAKQEMPRFAEFSANAINSSLARKEVSDRLSKHNLDYLMHKLPWDVYKEEKERWKDGD